MGTPWEAIALTIPLTISLYCQAEALSRALREAKYRHAHRHEGVLSVRHLRAQRDRTGRISFAKGQVYVNRVGYV